MTKYLVDIYFIICGSFDEEIKREIKDFDDIVALLDRHDIIRIGFFDKEYPYVVPMLFGFEVVESKRIMTRPSASE